MNDQARAKRSTVKLRSALLVVLLGLIPTIATAGDTSLLYMCNMDPTAIGPTPESACQPIVDRLNASANFHVVFTAWDCTYSVSGQVHSDRRRTITGTGLAWRWGDQHIEVVGTDVTVTGYFSPCYPGGTSSGEFSIWFVQIAGCPAGTEWNQTRRACLRYGDRYFDKPKDTTCPASNPALGNPIYPLTGVKRQEVELGISIGGEPIKLSYDTRFVLPGAASNSSMVAPPSFGGLWQSSLHKSMVLSASGGPGSAFSTVSLQRGGGLWSTASVAGFDTCSGSGGGSASTAPYVPTVEPNQRISFNGTTGQLLDGRSLTQEVYLGTGGASTVVSARGQTLTYSYSDATTPVATAPAAGLLIQVTDAFGHSVKFTYEQPATATLAPRIVSITDSTNRIVHAAYDTFGNLVSLTWPDTKVRIFAYERPDVPWALTGIRDENNDRYASYTYDNAGRASATELAGGVDKYAVNYADAGAPGWQVTETVAGDMICREHRWVAPTGASVLMPSGQTAGMGASIVQGMVRLTSKSQPAGSGCSASTSGQTYDPKGNVASTDDFNGTRACYDSDLSRNLETTRVEGLANTASCAGVIPAAAALPVGSRKVSTSWHPAWTLQTKVAEPTKLTTSVYNGQPDPTAGNVIVSCAPGTALLPDGKPIAVLCKKVEQATTDADGHLGASATLDTTVANRQWGYTYNQYGQVLTQKDPLNNNTTYAYYTDTVFTGVDPNAVGHTLGDLQTLTNALGKVTAYTKYNKAGQVLEQSDPNGVLTTNTYDLRQRLLTTSVGGQTTSYTYDPVGQLTRITQPNASWVGYEYDAAHRRKAVLDNLGNRIEYTLDNAGNTTAENVKDPLGVLARALSRSFDALGRVQQTTGRE